jgi:hypothetical protein
MAKNNDYISAPSIQKTPVATLQYIYLSKPDQFKAPDGTLAAPKYSVTVVLDAKDPVHAKYLKEFNELNDAVGQELLKGITKDKKSYRIKDICKEECDDNGDPTGRYFLKATTKNKPNVFDSMNKLLTDDIVGKAFGGSTGRVIMGLKKSVDTQRKTVGLVCYLDKAQLITIVEGTSSAGGFDVVDGGFVAPGADAGSDDVNF